MPSCKPSSSVVLASSSRHPCKMHRGSIQRLVYEEISEWFRTRLSPLLRSKAGQVKLWGLPKNVSLPKTLKNASLEILKIRS